MSAKSVYFPAFTRVALASGLLLFHLLQRFHESYVVEARSFKQVINPIRALLNLLYYPMATLTLFSAVFPFREHSREFIIRTRYSFNCSSPSSFLIIFLSISAVFAVSDLRPIDAVACITFAAASYFSKKTFHQFVKLRKNRFGNCTNSSFPDT